MEEKWQEPIAEDVDSQAADAYESITVLPGEPDPKPPITVDSAMMPTIVTALLKANKHMSPELEALWLKINNEEDNQ